MKKIILAVVAIILLIFAGLAVLAFTSSTEFKVEREIEIAKPKSEVFAYLKLLKNQNEWGPWTKNDPEIKLSYEGTDGEVGFISKWDSKHEEVGVGEQEIKRIVDGERIDYELRFKTPWEATNNAWMITEDGTSGSTKVRWGFTGDMPRPMNLMLLFTDFEALVGSDFEKGLASLKEVVEKLPSPKIDTDEESGKIIEKTKNADGFDEQGHQDAISDSDL